MRTIRPFTKWPTISENPIERGRRPSTRGPIWKPIFKTRLQANTAIRSVSLLSIRAERCSEDAFVDVAHELRRCCDLQMPDISFFLQEFTDRYESICRYHETLMSLIGFRLLKTTDKAAHFGSSDIVFSLDRVSSPRPATPADGVHIAFQAPDR